MSDPGLDDEFVVVVPQTGAPYLIARHDWRAFPETAASRGLQERAFSTWPVLGQAGRGVAPLPGACSSRGELQGEDEEQVRQLATALRDERSR